MTYLIVTSRCPFSYDKSHNKKVTKKNVGGVATALKLLIEKEGGVWVCWGDGKLDPEHTVEDRGNYKIVRVILNQKEKKGFYDEYSNGTLWPLFHYFRERIRFSSDGFKYYKQVNEKFKEKILKYLEPDMKVWIHDYQLTLLPGMLRKSGTQNFTLFTWHIPWVASEFFSILPEAEEIIHSLAKADMLTFHTPLYTSNFRASAQKILRNSLNENGKLFSISLGIDETYYEKANARKARVKSLEGMKMIFSIDRLDYTKGLINRVLAIENMLDRFPEYAGKFVYVMVVTPSRTSVTEYQSLKRELEMTIGRVNGEHGNLSWAPIIYMYRRISDKTLISYYSQADIALITPLMDGLNLVSKEFVSVTDSGSLIISQFAGSSYDLKSGALVVNPNNIAEMADAILYSLNMKREEIQRRLSLMKDNVYGKNLDWWLGEIESTADRKLMSSKESTYVHSR
ncbi:trehalose-6-phosphate synthase [uncultured archaeon]|nr:trehalose-6-phosphate synthase [uncultured archaeon]HKJ96553.1 trehalose-6-phosphate synthase [Thermoplasmataceae archaeon]